MPDDTAVARLTSSEDDCRPARPPRFIEFNLMKNDSYIIVLINLLIIGVVVLSVWMFKPQVEPLPPVPVSPPSKINTPVIPSVPCPNNVCPS